MRTIMPLIFFLSSFLGIPATMDAGPRTSPTSVLHQEISSLLKNRNLSFLEHETEMVTVDFVINAKNEIVVLHTYGNSSTACDYVKDVLNFKKVKFRQAKQLTPYVVNIRLIK